MGVQVYLCPSSGDGSAPTPAAGRRPALLDTLAAAGGFRMVAVFCRARSTWLCFVEASDAQHTACQALTGVVRLVPLLSVTPAQLRAHLDTQLATLFSPAQLTAVRADIEGKGFSMTWAGGTTTLRQVAQYLRQCCQWSEVCDGANGGAGNAQLSQFLQAGLDTTVGALPAAVRNAASAWMQARGLSTTWITGSTPVRQVQHYVAANVPFHPMITLDEPI